MYTSLKGFPFWEVLPYWLRILETDKPSGVICDEIFSGVLRLSNPMGHPLQVMMTSDWTQTSMVLSDTSSDFTNPKVVDRHLQFTVGPQQQIFLSLLDIGRVQFHFSRAASVSDVDIDFIDDMKQFAISWSKHDTEDLLMLVPHSLFQQPLFTPIASICRNIRKFSTKFVLLRALILHHFSFLRNRCRKIEAMPNFVSWEDSAELIIQKVKVNHVGTFPSFSIDRHAAQHLFISGQGDVAKCIISQLTAVFLPVPLAVLQCKHRPWYVTFVGEAAVDAGGPTRELMTLAASSIFEPTSRLVIPTPNSREALDSFVPFDATGTRVDDLRTIGHLLGMILRSGLAQDLPFAPFVWKFLAGETLTREDILGVDDQLRQQLEHAHELEDLTWSCTFWDGRLFALPGHAPGSRVKPSEIEQFRWEGVQFRTMTIKPFLRLIRESFRSNIGFKRHFLLNGVVLSRLIQGQSLLTVEQLKAITVCRGFTGPGDLFIVRLWRSVERFDGHQLKLLLKFITTLTRIPNTSVNPDFQIQISKLEAAVPNMSLPKAATCFNRLYLPLYSDDEICYEKVLYAVQFCQTMENW
jgi:hypothetical protein